MSQLNAEVVSGGEEFVMSNLESSNGNGDELHWRETYFIVFARDRRPDLKRVAEALAQANSHFQLENLASDERGLIESLLVESPEDHAVVEISYEVGDAVIEQNLEWAKQLQKEIPAEQLQELVRADARLDVAHFEKVRSGEEEQCSEFPTFGNDFDDPEEPFEMLDPTCLLMVVDTLSSITEGLTFDPASGEILA